MAKVITKTVTTYTCTKCEHAYPTLEEAEECESRQITHDKGVKVGDIVRITQGDGKGQKAKVTDINIIDKNWGHYAWERYWHTVSVTAELIEDWGARHLTFDSYEVIR